VDSHPFRYMDENTYLQKLCLGFSSVKLSFVKSFVSALPLYISKQCDEVDPHVYLSVTVTRRHMYMYVTGQIVNKKNNDCLNIATR